MTCQKAHGGPPDLAIIWGATWAKGGLYLSHAFSGGAKEHFIFDLNFAEAYICGKSCDHYIYMFARTNYTSYLSSYGSTWSSMWLRFCCTMYTISIRDYSNIIWTQIFFIQEHMSMVNVNPPLKKNSKTIFKANLIDVWKECLMPYLSTWTSMWLHVFTQVQYVTSHENHK